MQITNTEVIQDDVGYDLNFTLQDYSGGVINITGATIVLNVQKQHNTGLKFTGSMSIVSGPAGTCKYTVATGNFDEIGEFDAEIKVTISGQTVTYSGIKIRVLPKLPKS